MTDSSITRRQLEELMMSLSFNIHTNEDIQFLNQLYNNNQADMYIFRLTNTKKYFESIIIPYCKEHWKEIKEVISDENIKNEFIRNFGEVITLFDNNNNSSILCNNEVKKFQTNDNSNEKNAIKKVKKDISNNNESLDKKHRIDMNISEKEEKNQNIEKNNQQKIENISFNNVNPTIIHINNKKQDNINDEEERSSHELIKKNDNFETEQWKNIASNKCSNIINDEKKHRRLIEETPENQVNERIKNKRCFNKKLRIVIIIFLAIAFVSCLGYLCYTLFY